MAYENDSSMRPQNRFRAKCPPKRFIYCSRRYKIGPLATRRSRREILERSGLSNQSSGRPLGSQYLIFEVIGRGAMGTVYRGEVRDSGEPVAVKLLHSDLSSDPIVVSRFLQERDILTKLNHRNIVQVRDLVIERNNIAFILELVAGPNARTLLKREGRISQRVAFSIAAQICSGLAAAHSLDIVHRDIKPENILLDSTTDPATVKVTDFGIAKVLGMDALTRASSTLGTPEYMAPELFNAEVPSSAADVYAVGITLYELLAGVSPFAGGSPMMVMRRMWQEDAAPLDGLDAKAWQLLAKMLAKTPSERPSDVAELALQLDAVAKRLPDAKLPISSLAASLGVVTVREMRVSDLGLHDDGEGVTRISIPRPTAVEPPTKKSKRKNWEAEFARLKEFKAKELVEPNTAAKAKELAELDAVAKAPQAANKAAAKAEKISAREAAKVERAEERKAPKAIRRLESAAAAAIDLNSDDGGKSWSGRPRLIAGAGIALALVAVAAVALPGMLNSGSKAMKAQIQQSPSGTTPTKSAPPNSLAASSTPTASASASRRPSATPTPTASASRRPSASASPKIKKTSAAVKLDQKSRIFSWAINVTSRNCAESDVNGDGNCPDLSKLIPSNSVLINWKFDSQSHGSIQASGHVVESQVTGVITIKVRTSTGEVKAFHRPFHAILIANYSRQYVHWISS